MESITNKIPQKVAVVFLTNRPSKETMEFAHEVNSNTSFSVFVVVDDPEYKIPAHVDLCVTMEDEYAKANGYFGCNIAKGHTHINKDVIAWDKFVFIFGEIYNSFDFVWVFEDDVFIPSVETIKSINRKYASTYDLVTPNNFYHDPKLPNDWHWPSIIKEISAPHYFSMVCAMGLSRKLFQKIVKHKKEAGNLFHIEAMFNTIAMQNNLKVIDAFEFKSIVWKGEWSINEFLLLPDNVFHPKKETSEHPTYRKNIAEYSTNGFKPINMLPQFIKDLM